MVTDGVTEEVLAVLTAHESVGRTGGGTWGCYCGHVLADMKVTAEGRHPRHLARIVSEFFAARNDRAASVSRSELERALREAGPPEDSMATEDDQLRYVGRAEAVEIMRDMLELD